MKRGRFPQHIKRGSCVVTIYKTPKNGYPGFTVAHYDLGGKLCRRMFADFEEARNVAEKTAQDFAGGMSEALILTGQELLIYRRATEAMKKAGVPLDVGAIQFARSLADSNGSGAPIVSATSPLSVKAMPVAKVVDELLASKKAKGRSHLYLTDLRLRLKRFAKAFKRPLCEVTSGDIDQFLEALGIAARSQNNFRATIGTLIHFGQGKGYVAWDHPGIRHVDRASHVAQEIQVFTPEEMEKLLRFAKDDLVPVMAIGAFAGIRSEELKRLTWEEIHLKEGHIEIRSAKSKTKVRRLIPIQDNLKAWLLPHAHVSGTVVPVSNLGNQFGKLAKRAGVKWKKNGLRHSFISYRVALTNNIPMVSLEAGNSPAVILRNYLKCVSPSDARRWFGIFPEKLHRGSDGPPPCPQPTTAEQAANSGWQRTRMKSRSQEENQAQPTRRFVGALR